MGREVKGMVCFRDGQLIVMAPPPGGALAFGPGELAAAQELSAAITLGVADLRHLRAMRDRRPRPWER
jgi:predicted RNase H-like HicB family nuclease